MPTKSKLRSLPFATFQTTRARGVLSSKVWRSCRRFRFQTRFGCKVPGRYTRGPRHNLTEITATKKSSFTLNRVSHAGSKLPEACGMPQATAPQQRLRGLSMAAPRAHEAPKIYWGHVPTRSIYSKLRTSLKWLGHGYGLVGAQAQSSQ